MTRELFNALEDRRRDCLYTVRTVLSPEEAKYIRHDEQALRSAVHRKLFEAMLWPVIDKHFEDIERSYSTASLGAGSEEMRLELVIFSRKEWIEVCQRINSLERENDHWKRLPIL